MAESRKADYFGSFLDALKAKSVSAASSAAAAAGGGPAGSFDMVLHALSAAGAKGLELKQIIPLVGNSLDAAMRVTSQLEDFGFVSRAGPGFILTPQGEDVARAVKTL